MQGFFKFISSILYQLFLTCKATLYYTVLITVEGHGVISHNNQVQVHDGHIISLMTHNLTGPY